jgi:hypothetical protein
MKIRDRSGVTREVPDSYILQDGETFLVEPMFMDTRRMFQVPDVLMPRPTRDGGRSFADADKARIAVYDAYDAAIRERWRQGPPQPVPFGRSPPQTSPPQTSAPQTSAPQVSAPQTFDSPAAARDAAYRQYDMDISTRWQRR